MTRYRWLRVENRKISLRQLGSALESVGEGATVRFYDATAQLLAGAYVERVETQLTVETGPGSSERMTRVDVFNAKFRIEAGLGLLETEGSAIAIERMLKRLTPKLRILGTISRVVVSPLAWARALEKTMGRGRVVAAHLAGLSLSPGVGAQIQLASDADLRPTILELTRGKVDRVDRVQLCLAEQRALDAWLIADGRAISVVESERGLEALRAALAAAL